MARLRYGGADGERYFELAEGVVTIGRHPTCQIRINDMNLSRQHAEVRSLPGGGWEVVDLGSANGIVIDGQRVGRARLRGGMAIHLGTSVVTFEEVAAPRSTGLPPRPMPASLVRPSSVPNPPPPPPPPRMLTREAHAPTRPVEPIDDLVDLPLEPSGVNDLEELELDEIVVHDAADDATRPPAAMVPAPLTGRSRARVDEEPDVLRARREQDQMAARLRAMMDEVASLRAELEAAPSARQMAALASETAEQRATIETLQSRLDAARAALSRGDAEREAIAQELAEGRRALERGAAEREALAREVAEGRRALDRAESEAERASELEQRLARVTSEAARAAELDRQVSELTSENERLLAALERAVAERADHDAARAQMRAELAQAMDENERLREELETLQELLAQRNDTTGPPTGIPVADHEALRSAFEDLRQELALLLEENEILRRRTKVARQTSRTP